jgi:hypothetical protein
MKKFNLCLTLISVVMLVGLTNCKKDTENTSVTKYVGTVNGSFIAKDASIKVNKDLAPDQLVTRNWIMYAKNSPFYGNQTFALVKGLEFIQGSAANIWWSTNGNNPVSFAASQAVYSNLTPAEPVRLIMEGYSQTDPRPAYLAIIDFDPTQAQFPLTVVSKSLGDVFIVNADALYNLPGGNLLTITATYNGYPVDIQATEKKLQLSAASGSLATGVTGAFDFSDIVYGAGSIYNPVTEPVGHGDCLLASDIATKVMGDIIITITEAPSPSSPGVNGSVIHLTVPASAVGLPGFGTKLVLTTTKLGWYDSTTIGVTDNDIKINTTYVPVN